MRILKLGGSVITDKDKPFTPNTQNIERLAAEVAASMPTPLVIVHGGGSYGHPVAKQYKISDGYKNPGQLAGFSRTHQAMVQLNKIIVDALLDAGVPAFSLSPSSFIVTEARRITELDTAKIRRYLGAGMIPVLYGDAVLDTQQGFAILSGDQLVMRLATSLKADRIVLGSDVDGVYTADPKLVKEARLIPRLSLKELDGMVKIGEALNTDVTGGMLGKVREAAETVADGVEVILVNAGEAGRVETALRGEKVMGTVLTR
ncbi:MAG TPA: isopentenyl phosphate kinase [Candidatus Desulfaltia sp.]|nr:isopentenyl phosphate kinase [Candidatus Desulfaltia sp.]